MSNENEEWNAIRNRLIGVTPESPDKSSVSEKPSKKLYLQYGVQVFIVSLLRTIFLATGILMISTVLAKPFPAFRNIGLFDSLGLSAGLMLVRLFLPATPESRSPN